MAQILKKIKSDFFLRNLFNNNLNKKKSLEIVKYNNNTKQRLNLNINDYKEYCETYSSIEIEIIPAKDKYGKFINIKEEDRKYYHIFFNNNNYENKINILNKIYDNNVKKIKIIIDYKIESFEYLFKDCQCIESINFKKFYRNNFNNT